MRSPLASPLTAFFLGIALVCAPSGLELASGEVFLLRSGGRVQGEWLNRQETPREKYVIRTRSGGEVAFAREQVDKVLFQSEAEQEYARLRLSEPDTVAGHEKLAAWCLEKQLLSQRKSHLRRIIELDPDNSDARTALGFKKTAGQWMTRDQFMASRGMKLYKGRYRTVQEIEIWEAERKSDLANREWHNKIDRWHDWLAGDKRNQAVQNFREIRDPYAVEALSGYLKQEKLNRLTKLLYVETLGQVDSAAALKALVETSLSDADQEVRLSCLDQVIRSKNPDAVTLYIIALKSKSNVKVNRAAHALRELGSPEAIHPLIEALVTEHKFKVTTGTQSGQTSATFSPNGGGGLAFGGKGPKIIKQAIQNRQVLSALIVLTEGSNFEYNVDSWKAWYASNQRTQTFNARRD